MTGCIGGCASRTRWSWQIFLQKSGEAGRRDAHRACCCRAADEQVIESVKQAQPFPFMCALRNSGAVRNLRALGNEL
jgi:hypothetical protein